MLQHTVGEAGGYGGVLHFHNGQIGSAKYFKG